MIIEYLKKAVRQMELLETIKNQEQVDELLKKEEKVFVLQSQNKQLLESYLTVGKHNLFDFIFI